MKMMLLEPYRTALFAMGIMEGLVPLPANVSLDKIASTKTFEIGTDRILQHRLCQLLILFDQVSIIQHENEDLSERVEDSETPGLSALRLNDLGLVKFEKPPQGGESRLSALQSAKTLEDIWRTDRLLLDIWEPAIIGQMQAKGKLEHPSLYYLLKAMRLGYKHDAIKSVPADAQPFAELLVRDKIPEWDLVVFSTLNELIGVEEIAAKGEWSIASEALYHENGEFPNPDLNLDVFEFAVKELLECDISFPVCESLNAVVEIRRNNAVTDFRDVFFTWLTTFKTGDIESEKKMRKEVKRMVRAFRFHGHMETLGWLVAFAAIPAGIINMPIGFGAGCLGMGLQALAVRWRNKSRWLGICAKR